jgi:uncharacterized delta-60 repeat protein
MTCSRSLRRSLALAAVAATSTLALAAALSAVPSRAAPTSPVGGFSGDGVAEVAAGEVLGDQLVLDDGGQYLVTYDVGEPTLVVRRVRADGVVDGSFGSGGAAVIDTLGGVEDVVLARDPRRGLLYVSAFSDGSPFPTSVWRLRRDGAPDPTWAAGGRLTMEQTVVGAMVVQPDGRLVLAGQDFDDGLGVVWRLDTSGAPDPSFGTGGRTVVRAGAEGVDLLRNRDGSYVVGLREADIVVARLRPDGEPDPRFSGDGVAVVTFPAPGGFASTGAFDVSLAQRPDGSVVATAPANVTGVGFQRRVAVVQLTRRGTADPRFRSGLLPVQVTSTDGELVLQRNGRVVVSTGLGDASSGFGPEQGALVRLTTRGRLDRSFSGDGVLPLPSGRGGADLGLAADGRLLTAETEDFAAPAVTLRAYRGDRVPRCLGRLATQFGGGGRDRLVGTPYADVLIGLGGRDTLLGRGAADRLCGNAGRDRLVGGPGRDRISGGPGKDRERP